MKYFSLFSGVGGFEIAINRAYESYSVGRSHPDCIGFSEIDKYAISVYKYHYPTHQNYGDIKEINWQNVPDFDLLVGGSPCQDLSVAGKQKGLLGERSGLFFEFIRCLKEKQPTNFIWENVKGALSSNLGWDFARVQIEFSEAGYDIEWQVLNAKDFGVPQNRERIFIVGHLRGRSQPKVFPFGSYDQTSVDQGDKQGCSNTLTARSAGGQNRRGNYIAQVNKPRHSNDRVYLDTGVSPSLNTMQGGRRQPKIVVPVTSPDRLNKFQNGRRFKEDGDPSFTLSSVDRHGIFDGFSIRRLTPLECERLMSWPDNWTMFGRDIDVPVSDTQRYKMCGNGVVSSVVVEVLKRLI